MRRRGLGVVFMATVLAVAWSPALAQEGDAALADAPESRLGEPFALTLQVDAAPGATVEVDPVAASWDGVEMLEILRHDIEPVEGGARHRIELRVAAFLPGERRVAPAVFVVEDGVATPRELPAFTLSVPSTLAADAPLELVGGPEPRAIGGGQSPLLVPLVVLAAAVGVAAAGRMGWLLVRRTLRRRRSAHDDDVPQDLLPGLPAPEALLADPVPAYRAIGAAVRHVIADRYGFPARALATTELIARMQAEGVDRWQARLVQGLLENCDAVIYAGQRPSEVRRQADLTMAEEILEAFP